MQFKIISKGESKMEIVEHYEDGEGKAKRISSTTKHLKCKKHRDETGTMVSVWTDAGGKRYPFDNKTK